MKRINVFILIALAAIALASCSKEKRCMCNNVTENEGEPVQTYYVNTDRGFGCKKITRLGVERLVEGNLVRDMIDVTCKEAR